MTEDSVVSLPSPDDVAERSPPESNVRPSGVSWLEGLKAGDIVVQVGSGYYSDPVVAAVTRTTATQIVVGNTRYRRRNGRMFGSSWTSAHIAPPQPHLLEKARRAVIALRLRNEERKGGNFSGISIQKLERIAAILDEDERGVIAVGRGEQPVERNDGGHQTNP